MQCRASWRGETKAIAALAKTYRTMKANDGFGRPPKLLADAVARLCPETNRGYLFPKNLLSAGK